MNIACRWLSDYIDLTQSPEELSQILTSIGLEVEEIHSFRLLPQSLDGLVVGHVEDVWPHPNADRLRVTKVNVGNTEPLQIVCGAPNVAKGQKVVVATVGSTLQPTSGEAFTIKKSKIRGEASEGMICAEDEIGLGESHEGVMVLDENAPVGQPLTEYLTNYEDKVIEIGLTPNRADAASHLGVARDLAAWFRKEVRQPARAILPVNTGQPCPVEIEIADPDDCIRYSGLVMEGVKVQPSPEWLQHRLLSVGLTPINNIVDATNYVMHELGQPLHAFDLEKIGGRKIIVASAKKGESLETLDGKERKLDAGELTIRDVHKPLALAGVFGGKGSGINDDTEAIFIESANFRPGAVRHTARTHGLSTDASFRYERGADPNVTVIALERIALLLKEIADAKAVGGIRDVYPNPVAPVVIPFSIKYLERIGGVSIPAEEVESILAHFGMKVISVGMDIMQVEVPTWKVDVTRPVDLAEEVLRIWSYDKIPFHHQVRSIVQTDPLAHRERQLQRVYHHLAARGFYEIYQLSMVGEEMLTGESRVELVNPLSRELNYMRDNLLLPGLKAVAHNLNRQQRNVRLFKRGNVYSHDNKGYSQRRIFALWLTGQNQLENWGQTTKPLDIYYLKGLVSELLELFNYSGTEDIPQEHGLLSQSMSWSKKGRPVAAWAGQVQASVAKKHEVEVPVFYAELDLDEIFAAGHEQKLYTPISRFPRVERDLAMVVPAGLDYRQIESSIRKQGGELLRSIRLFDVYQGAPLAPGETSYAVRMIFENPKATLEEKQLEKLIQGIIKRLTEDLNVQIRS